MARKKQEKEYIDNSKIINRSMVDDMEKSYIDYAMNVLCDRSVPDVRDGCKPIHRRILWAMYNLHNTPDKPHKKSARIVGETMGKYHPHGDCYDADTKIYLLDGTIKTIKELTDIGKEQWILAVDEKTNKVVPAKAHSFRIGQYATKIYTIRLSNGYELKVTGNHPFRLTNGTWVKAENLQINQVIDFIHLNVGSDGYLSISSPHKEQGYEKLHCLVSDCCGINGEVIHHRDGNRFNVKYFDKDSFVIFRNDKLPIISDIIVSEYDSAVPMYDFTVDDYHNMFIPANDDNSMLIVGHNSSIYGAAVRMAQDFSLRYPLVDGHGNFGSVDGDHAASSRYTEIRMSEFALEMVKDINKDIVNFVPNFDGEEIEPVALPSRVPNLLLNGANGIAVGFTTNIPPHNLSDTVDALIYMIDSGKKYNIDELIKVIKGPDFPTGGQILGAQGINDIYKTGQGKIVMRAKCSIEKGERGKSHILIHEIPYGVNKAKLVEKIAELVKDKKISGISEIRDESSREGFRIFVEVKKDVNPELILNQLYQLSDLQCNFSAIILVLSKGVPKVMTLDNILLEYLEFQRDVIRRRTEFDLNKAQERLHLVEGFLIALDNIDEVIKIIRNSTNNAKERLIKKFKFTEIQAQAILDMRLARLQKLEVDKLKKEHADLVKFITKCEKILKSPKQQMNIVKKELLEIKEKYGDKRRTKIVKGQTGEIEVSQVVESCDCYVYITGKGFINRVSMDKYDRIKKSVNLSDKDFIKEFIKVNTQGTLLCFTDKGTVYRTAVHQIDESKSEQGFNMRDVFGVMLSENIVGVCYTEDYSPKENIIVVSSDGQIKKVAMSELVSDRKSFMYTKLKGDALVVKVISDGDFDILLSTRNCKTIRFSPSNIRPMGRNAVGVNAITLSDDEVVSVLKLSHDVNIGVFSSNGYIKMFNTKEIKKQARGGKGLLLCDTSKFKMFGDVVSAFLGDTDSIFVINDEVMSVIPMDSIGVTTRTDIGKKVLVGIESVFSHESQGDN